MKLFRLTPCAAAVAVALLQMPEQAFALNCTLTTNGLWQTTGDWSCGARPGNGDAATINVGGLVTINQAEQITTLNNAGTITIDAFLLSLNGGGSTTNSGTINVGGVSTAALQVFNNITNTGGTINVGNGSVINQFGTTISGGIISTAGTGALVASNSGANFLNNVTLNGTLDLASGTAQEQVQNGLVLNGAININNNSILAFGGNQSVSGTGSIVLGTTGGSNRINVEAGNLTLGSGVTIRGQNGTIGNQNFAGGAATLTNNGTISADVAGGTISLGINGLTTNNGVLEAKNGGTLNLNSNVAGGVGGSINAAAGSTVVQNGIAISGNVNTTGTGSFTASNSGANFLNGVALNGKLDLASGTAQEQVTGGLTLAPGSAININNNSIIAFQGNQTLGGTGTIVLGATGGGNRINLEVGDLTVGSGITIRGQNGTIGNQNFVGGPANLINNGRISADVALGTITIQNNGTVINNGILEAQNGGTLALNRNVIGNAGSHIDAGAGSTVLQNGITISGVVNTSGGGNFTVSNSGANFLDGVAFTGSLDLASGTAQEQVKNGLVLNGAINLNSNSILAFEGNHTISGNGTIVLGATGGGNRVNVEAGDLVLGPNITIRGQNGTIGNQNFVGGAATLTNNGTISADVSGGTISLGINGLTTNNGVLEAKNGGTLLLNSNIAGTASGSINSGAGSTVVQNGITISGIINTTGGGTFTASNSGSNFLDNVTLNGTLDLASGTAQEQVKNGLVINGAININANSILAFEGNQTISGNGTIALGATGGGNRVNIEAGNLTLGANILIHGENGTIGNQNFVGGPAVVNNNGRISADVAGGTIGLGITGVFNNNATLEAKNGGTLQLNSAITNSGSGHIDAIGANSRVVQNGVTVSGGTINSTGGGVFAATNSGTNFLSNVNVAGTVDAASGTAIERITSGLAFSGGTINVNSNSILAFEGIQSITGNGTIVLGATGGGNRINLEAGSLTIGSGVTFRGQNGTFGNQNFAGGPADLTNNGTIAADVSGGLISLNANGTLINGGTFGAANGGTLAIGQGFTGTGTIQTASGGTVALAGAATQGKLINDGNIALGVNNLTITNDYNNANFGTGNSFNRRSNVAGTGQILASGTAAQAITGTNVTNGASATPTLTIGNVHVGNNTFSYQVANSGTTGPSIRGAIQTNVNGGNVTDTRLSGSGVTASNYGPVATGANSGNLAVNFNAASAGALAPLSGQAVHIANNFDNLSQQTLGIVIGAGAGAFNLAAGNATPSPIVFGNAHVNDIRTQGLTVTNTAPAGAFTEGLNASFGANSGNVSNNGNTISLLAGQASNNSALSVSLNTSAAGARSGTATVNYVSDGSGTSGLGQTGAGSQTINVSGNVFNLASSSVIGAINFGVRHVGDGTITQNLSVTNTAAAGLFSEGLDSSFGAFSGSGGSKISTIGAIVNQAAGATNGSTLQVRLDTSTVGMVNGTLRINQASNGTISGLANTALAGQDPSVTADVQSGGMVVRFASPLINNAPVNFGNVRINSAQNQALSITNNVPNDGFSESLIGSTVGTSNAGVTAAGAFGAGTANPPSLAPTATDTTHIVVGLNTTTAGSKNGNAIIDFKSDGTGFAGGVITDLGNTNVAVQGNVYRLANAVVNTPTVTVAARVGGASPSTGISITNSSPDVFTEGLNVTRGATAAGFTSAGSITNLAAAGTSANGITVALNTTIAGTFTGTQALNFVSTGAGTTGAPDLSVGSGSVNLNGKVYTPAVAQLNTLSVDFGIVHRGDAVAQQNVSVTNSAPTSALNDVLLASFSSASSPFSGSGSLGAGLAAQATSANALKVGINTGAAGVYSGTATFGAASHDADLSDAALANLVVNLSGQVNNFATDAFTFGSGSGNFTHSGSTFILDFGTVAQGSGTRNTTLFAGNSATGPADLLDGTFQLLDPADFSESGFNNFLNLFAGQNTGPLLLSFNSSALGSFTDTFTLHGIGHNASGYSAAIGDIQLIIRGVVGQAGNNVPEPDSLLLLGLGVPLLFVRRKARKSVAH